MWSKCSYTIVAANAPDGCMTESLRRPPQGRSLLCKIEEKAKQDGRNLGPPSAVALLALPFASRSISPYMRWGEVPEQLRAYYGLGDTTELVL